LGASARPLRFARAPVWNFDVAAPDRSSGPLPWPFRSDATGRGGPWAGGFPSETSREPKACWTGRKATTSDNALRSCSPRKRVEVRVFMATWRSIGILAVGVLSCGATACFSEVGSGCSPSETQSCTCAGGVAGLQACADDGKSWRACDCSDCKAASRAAMACGCWGPAIGNQIVTEPLCCSTKALTRACSGSCLLGGPPWQNICQ
jgi:hypothetical protein